jgi:hypothetical protein
MRNETNETSRQYVVNLTDQIINRRGYHTWRSTVDFVNRVKGDILTDVILKDKWSAETLGKALAALELSIGKTELSKHEILQSITCSMVKGIDLLREIVAIYLAYIIDDRMSFYGVEGVTPFRPKKKA